MEDMDPDGGLQKKVSREKLDAYPKLEEWPRQKWKRKSGMMGLEVIIRPAQVGEKICVEGVVGRKIGWN